MPPPAGTGRVVVSDAGPLICLGCLDLLQLLPALFASVQVPEPVLQECSSRPQSPDAARILAAVDQGWLNPCGPQPLPDGSLGRGERAAIARALAIGTDLLSDDLEARTQAESLQLRVIGTLGVLVRGKRAGLIPAVAPLVEQLRASGQRFGHGVVSQALAAAGERIALRRTAGNKARVFPTCVGMNRRIAIDPALRPDRWPSRASPAC